VARSQDEARAIAHEVLDAARARGFGTSECRAEALISGSG